MGSTLFKQSFKQSLCSGFIKELAVESACIQIKDV